MSQIYQLNTSGGERGKETCVNKLTIEPIKHGVLNVSYGKLPYLAEGAAEGAGPILQWLGPQVATASEFITESIELNFKCFGFEAAKLHSRLEDGEESPPLSLQTGSQQRWHPAGRQLAPATGSLLDLVR